MGNTVKRIICLLCAALLISAVLPLGAVEAESNESVKISHVYLTYGEEDVRDVIYQVVNLESGVMGKAYFDVELDTPMSGLTYKLSQYNAGTGKRYDLGSFSSPSFDIDASTFYKDIPFYLGVFRGSTALYTVMLTIRVNEGRAENLVTPQVESLYKENIEVDMSEFLPGMKFEMHPYIIPITAKTYTDGISGEKSRIPETDGLSFYIHRYQFKSIR